MEEREIGFWDLLFYYYKFRWYIFSFILFVVLFVGVLSFLTPPKYKATTRLLTDKTSFSNTMLWDIGDGYVSSMQMNNYKYMLKSRTLAENVVKDLRNEKIDFVNNDTDSTDWWISVKNGIDVNVVPKSDIIEISYTHGSPEIAALIANTIAKEFYNMQQEMSRAEIKGMCVFLEQQLAKVKKQLENDEDSLMFFKQRIGVADISEEIKKNIEIYSNLEAGYQNAQIMKEYYKKKADKLGKELGIKENQQDAFYSSVLASPSIITLKEKLSDKEAEKAEFLAKGYELTHPRIKELNKEIELLKEEIAKNMNTKGLVLSNAQINNTVVSDFINTVTELVALNGKIESYDTVLKKMRVKLNMLPSWGTDIARKERNKTITEQIYLMLKKKYEELKISEAGKLGNVKIMDKAYPPKYPVSPRKKRNVLLAFIFSVFIGVLFILIYALIDDGLHSSEEIERLAHLPVLAVIPYAKLRGKKEKRAKIPDFIRHRLISHFSPMSLTAEAYKTLRTQLLFLIKNKKVLLITSSLKGEGKTTVAINLAITIAQTGKKVVVVDADIRRPVLYKVFNQNLPEYGLAHYLLDGITEEDIIYSTDVENLYIISHGMIPSNPSEIFHREKMHRLLKYLRENFDYIIMDSPPVMAVTDPIILSSFCDSVVFVVSAKKSSRRAFKVSLKQMRTADVPIAGIVFNNVSFDGRYGNYYKYKYDYYYHYYSDEK